MENKFDENLKKRFNIKFEEIISDVLKRGEELRKIQKALEKLEGGRHTAYKCQMLSNMLFYTFKNELYKIQNCKS